MKQLEIWLDRLMNTLDIDKAVYGISDKDIHTAEECLTKMIPPSLKLVYKYVGNNKRFTSSVLEKTYMLPLNKL